MHDGRHYLFYFICSPYPTCVIHRRVVMHVCFSRDLGKMPNNPLLEGSQVRLRPLLALLLVVVHIADLPRQSSMSPSVVISPSTANEPLPAIPADNASPDVPAKISAYYSLVFPNITFFLQTLTVTIGRRCLPPTSASPNGTDGPSSSLSPVDVDLGPLKSVSRLHARIEYEEEEARFALVVIGRNGAWVDGVWSGAGSRVPLGERCVSVSPTPPNPLILLQVSDSDSLANISLRASSPSGARGLPLSIFSLFPPACPLPICRHHFHIPSIFLAISFSLSTHSALNATTEASSLSRPSTSKFQHNPSHKGHCRVRVNLRIHVHRTDIQEAQESFSAASKA